MNRDNLTRETLIKKLVDRKLASGDKHKVGCVPCFGRVLCFAVDRGRSPKK
ncbi:MAG: hypothetical protein K8U57_39325 [Planctomycetes bacterium]|nr:hypothetical protein [Planctomycetota bacterium]